MTDLDMSSNKQCQGCHREFSVFIRPYSCELCNQHRLCSNCARKFVLSYEPNPSFLRLCNKCCDKVSRGNQLNNSSSKLSKNRAKSSSVWSFASYLMGRSSKKRAVSPPPKSSKQLQSIKLSSRSPPPSCINCIYCCSTQNKLTNNKFAEHTHPLKDQAPLFPKNYNMSTPQRKEKQNMIFRHRMDSDDQQSIDSFMIQNNNNDDNQDDDDDYYHTMHPLNNLKLKSPKSILSISKNQFALNISINKEETQYYVGNLDKTSLCDCFSYAFERKQRDEILTEYNDNINRFCHCVTTPINHKIFKRLRIDLLFDNKEYDELIKNNNEKKEKYVSMNILLYDNKSQIWSGVQTVKISEIKPYKIISKIHVECKQTLIKKSVNIIGSMSWINNTDEDDDDAVEFNNNYPYKSCNISQMISILTQQRYDIIDSYSTVIQQRKVIQNQDEETSSQSLRKNIEIGAKKEKDGGSNIVKTKGTASLSLQNGSTSMATNCISTKHPHSGGIMVEEMEKNMLEEEIARIDSMILGLENAESSDTQKQNIKMENKQFDEITSSVASSNMFNTNEINKVKLQIADHLNAANMESQQLISNKKQNENLEKNGSNVSVSNAAAPSSIIPVCLSCQRCSRTIMLCQQISR